MKASTARVRPQSSSPFLSTRFAEGGGAQPIFQGRRNAPSALNSFKNQHIDGKRSLTPTIIDESGIKSGEENSNDAFKVYVRVRPMNERELGDKAKSRFNSSIIRVHENMVRIFYP